MRGYPVSLTTRLMLLDTAASLLVVVNQPREGACRTARRFADLPDGSTRLSFCS